MRQPQSPRYHWTCHKYIMIISKTLYSSTSGTFSTAVKRDGQQMVTVVYFYCLSLQCLGYVWQIVKCYITYLKHVADHTITTNSSINGDTIYMAFSVRNWDKKLQNLPVSTYDRIRSGNFCFTNWEAKFCVSGFDECRRAKPNTTSCTGVNFDTLFNWGNSCGDGFKV